jgi:hypothetical protein
MCIAVAELEAHHQLAHDALADRALAAVRHHGDADFLVAAAHARSVVRHDDPAQRGVDQRLGTAALLVRIVEELGDDDAALVGHVHARIRNAREEGVFADRPGRSGSRSGGSPASRRRRAGDTGCAVGSANAASAC